MSGTQNPGQGGRGGASGKSVTFQQLSVEAKRVAREGWKRDNPGAQPKSDAEIDQKLSQTGEMYDEQGNAI